VNKRRVGVTLGVMHYKQKKSAEFAFSLRIFFSTFFMAIAYLFCAKTSHRLAYRAKPPVFTPSV
jgi:hypothetical protein